MNSCSIVFRSTLIATLVLSCCLFQGSGICAARETRRVAVGLWGGEHVRLQVSGEGAEVEFDCARGRITQPLMLDKDGDFDAAGTFTAEHGGPVTREDEARPPDPARYSGHVGGDTMVLKVTRGDEKLGSFTLARNSNPILTKCR